MLFFAETLTMPFAYIGPETILPLASILGAIGGVLMMFWNTFRRGLTWCVQRRPKDDPAQPGS